MQGRLADVVSKLGSLVPHLKPWLLELKESEEQCQGVQPAVSSVSRAPTSSMVLRERAGNAD